MFIRTGSNGSTCFSWGRFTHYSDRLHDFSVTIPRCYEDAYVNSFFPRLAWLWNSVPIECFPLTYDLSGFKSRIKTSFNCRFFLKRFPVCFNLFVLLFLVTPCLVVAVQPSMEWIPIKKTNKLELATFWQWVKGSRDPASERLTILHICFCNLSNISK